MKLLKLGVTGIDVEMWQFFLIGQKFYEGNVDGEFGKETYKSTIAFQIKYNLNPDGKVGDRTVGQAMLLGFGIIIDDYDDISSAGYPKRPTFDPLPNNEARQALFGTFAYEHKPTPSNKERIVITDNWEIENIITVNIPQLIPIKGSSKIRFHKKGSNQLIQLFNDWERHKLLHYIKTWDGDYNARFIRGKIGSLSCHAFGIAFDINYEWNKLNTVPALVGTKGSVRLLVEIANDNGFFWGGHFTKPMDGMHFEITYIK